MSFPGSDASPPEDAFDHLRLAGVIRLSLDGRGPKDAYVFDPHRLAFPCWRLALGRKAPALLLTLDRHLDLVPPADPSGVPDCSRPVACFDTYARESLNVRNVDHILAAMEAGLLSDALVIARSTPRGARTGGPYVDSRGRSHALVVAPTVDRLAEGFGESLPQGSAAPQALEAGRLIQEARHIVLDVDLDCFTSPSDADPTTVLPWPREVIREHLLPRGSEPFWAAVLEKTVALTFAREPSHCGGLLASNRLFADVCQVLFCELLQTDLP